MGSVGWRLTLEPCLDLVAWSLLRAEAGAEAEVQAWSGLVADAARLRATVRRALDGALLDPVAEVEVARELGGELLPAVLQRALLAADEPPLVTICTRGWLSQVAWDALAIGQDGARLVQQAVVLGGLPAGLVEGPPADETLSFTDPGLWVIDPGPPDGRWQPLYPAGYPATITACVPATDQLVPDGLPFAADDLAAALASQRWARLVYFGHIANPAGVPAGVGLVLGGADGADLLTAHRWLRSPERWPMPSRVALLGCGSDDSGLAEQTGLVTAAMNAGAAFVTATRWPLANTKGAIRLLSAVSAALLEPSVLTAMRAWQDAELERWRSTGDPDSSPLYWAAAVSYDRHLLATGVRHAG